MTKIKFFKRNGYLYKFECAGHTGYDDNGKDILCATVSGLTQGCILGITKVLNINATVNRDDKAGYISVELPQGLADNILAQTQILFETLVVCIKDLQSGYSKYIFMEVIEDVY